MRAKASPRGQHSSVDLRCQLREGRAAPDARAGRERQVGARYGAAALRAGYTAIPNLLLRHYHRLGLSAAELVCVQQLCSFWWDDRLPHPAVGTIAARMGKCVRQVQSYLATLQRRGLLDVVPRQGSGGERLSNAYDLRPLFAALVGLEEGEDYGPASLAPAHHDAPATPQRTAPEEDALRNNTQIDLDSIRAREGGGDADTRGGAPRPPAVWCADRYARIEPTNPAGAGLSPPVPDPPPAALPRTVPPAIRAETVPDPVPRRVAMSPRVPSGLAASVTHRAGTAQRPGSTESADRRNDSLAALLGTLSRRFGDAAPRSSLARIRRLAAAARLAPVDAADLLAEAADRTARRRSNGGDVRAGMPYLLATFEALARASAAESAPVRLLPPGTRPGTQVPGRRAQGVAPPTALELPADAPPLWRAVVDEVSRALPPTVTRQLLPLRATQGSGLLRIVAPSAFVAQWLERALRRHITRALEDLGHADTTLAIEHAAEDPQE